MVLRRKENRVLNPKVSYRRFEDSLLQLTLAAQDRNGLFLSVFYDLSETPNKNPLEAKKWIAEDFEQDPNSVHFFGSYSIP